jgi:hypothetical protein
MVVFDIHPAGATYPMGLAAGPGGKGASAPAASTTKNPLANPVASTGRGSSPAPEKNDDFDFGDMSVRIHVMCGCTIPFSVTDGV